MPNQIVTQRDAIRYTAGRVAVTATITALVTMIFLISDLGTDWSATVQVGAVVKASMMVALGVSTTLSGAMAYRSAQLMRQLTSTRAELVRMSRTDLLTGLLNRRGFDDAASAQLAQANFAGQPVVAMMCDIDRFKAINDLYGHTVGDRVLAEIGGILRDFAAPRGMLIARHGGEEFAGLMVGVSDQEARDYALELCRRCATEVVCDGREVAVTMSFGLASYDAGGLSALMRRADLALYRAKDLGRNCVVQLDNGDTPTAVLSAPSGGMREAEIAGDHRLVAGNL
ncbi:GGDEF domain-containing protein [Rhodopseudomonas sp. BR0M22]|uniref:GGDEF domain-containing protein n=1 Tax=Rhodopseudomonas sp. BR0M22 TaxID=2269369 RepID=UPI0013E076A6|nr:GGDEF domain-containing protein [Rhodopseudomonas sp. BR0M22]NEW92246.1 GGDEF domain-containing protein [Rhodopseudomonas sp. BR0M22]